MGYLSQLCAMSGFSPEITPRSLSAKDFDKLLKTIQKLAGFSPDNERQVVLLPKITVRFYSTKRKVEFYLAGYGDLLTKNQAIKWVEAHKLDAVIVHKSNGDIYLRSKPGHHFDQIHFSQKDYGVEQEFKDAVKEIGEPVKKIFGDAHLIAHLRRYYAKNTIWIDLLSNISDSSS